MSVERSGEYRGKTVDAAISAALAALRVNLEQVDIEIIRPGSRGVLGIGAEDAIIRVTVKQSPDREPRPAPARKTTDSAPVTPAPAAAAPAAAAPVTPAPAAAAPATKAEPGPETAPRTRTRRTPKPAPAPAAAESEPGSHAGGADKDAAAAEQGSVILDGLLEHMGLKARVEVIQQSALEAGDGDPVLVLNILGDDLGVLIGRQNEVLSALEMITRLMVNQQSHMHSNFVVDVNGHRARRAEALRKLALRMAEQAVESGRTMVLEPMPPSERRIVHMTLRENPAVNTQSIGEGDHRKVTIIPVKS